MDILPRVKFVQPILFCDRNIAENPAFLVTGASYFGFWTHRRKCCFIIWSRCGSISFSMLVHRSSNSSDQCALGCSSRHRKMWSCLSRPWQHGHVVISFLLYLCTISATGSQPCIYLRIEFWCPSNCVIALWKASHAISLKVFINQSYLDLIHVTYSCDITSSLSWWIVRITLSQCLMCMFGWSCVVSSKTPTIAISSNSLLSSLVVVIVQLFLSSLLCMDTSSSQHVETEYRGLSDWYVPWPIRNGSREILMVPWCLWYWASKHLQTTRFQERTCILRASSETIN